MLNADYTFFNEHRDEYVRDHLNDYVVIKNSQALGFFKNKMDAFISMKDTPLGSFIIQKCVPVDQEIIEYHTRRVAFA